MSEVMIEETLTAAVETPAQEADPIEAPDPLDGMALRAYPDNPDQHWWKAMRAKAKWSMAM